MDANALTLITGFDKALAEHFDKRHVPLSAADQQLLHSFDKTPASTKTIQTREVGRHEADPARKILQTS